MLRRTPHHCIAFLYVIAMNDYVCHKLYRNVATMGNVDIGPSAIDCLEAIHDELFPIAARPE